MLTMCSFRPSSTSKKGTWQKASLLQFLKLQVVWLEERIYVFRCGTSALYLFELLISSSLQHMDLKPLSVFRHLQKLCCFAFSLSAYCSPLKLRVAIVQIRKCVQLRQYLQNTVFRLCVGFPRPKQIVSNSFQSKLQLPLWRLQLHLHANFQPAYICPNTNVTSVHISKCICSNTNLHISECTSLRHAYF